MKSNIILFFACIVVFFSCKNETKQNDNLEENKAKSYSQNDGLITIKGDFVYYADAAVLQTKTDVYGVIIDENMQALNNKVKPLKKEKTDMVTVTVRVKKIKKPEGEEGWPYRLEIKEILKVEAPQPNKEDVIKIGN